MSSGEMVAQARSRALPPLVGDLNVESEVLRRVLHAEAVDDGQGEQLDVLICKGLPGLGELGDRLVEQGTDVVLGITCDSGDRLHFDAGGPRLTLTGPGVSDSAVDELHAEIAGADIDGAQAAKKPEDQVVVDVGVLVEGEPGSADAEPAEAAGCQSDREDAVRLGSGRLAGAGDDGGPDPVALGVVGVFEEEAFELAWPHVCGR